MFKKEKAWSGGAGESFPRREAQRKEWKEGRQG
jgi:hypothetical protein